MRKMVAVAAATLALMGCSSEADDGDTVGGVPANCADGAETFAKSEDDTGIGAAASAVTMPNGVVYMGTQSVDSIDAPGRKDVVVRICSEGIEESAHREVATDLAAAIEAADRPEVAIMKVSAWVPDGEYTATERVLTVDDYEIFLWSGDFAEGIEPDDRWEVTSNG